MSAAVTWSKICGHSSLSHPCSVMSGQTPLAISWSTALMNSTSTPLRLMISAEMSMSPRVWDVAGDLFTVVLMNRAD